MKKFWKQQGWVGWPMFLWRILWWVPLHASLFAFMLIALITFGPSHARRIWDTIV